MPSPNLRVYKEKSSKININRDDALEDLLHRILALQL